MSVPVFKTQRLFPKGPATNKKRKELAAKLNADKLGHLAKPRKPKKPKVTTVEAPSWL